MEPIIDDQRHYPHGVPSWVDVCPPDLEAAAQLYRALFGWTFANPAPPVGRRPVPTPMAVSSTCGRRAAGSVPSWSTLPTRGTSATCTPPTPIRRSRSIARCSVGRWMPTAAPG